MLERRIRSTKTSIANMESAGLGLENPIYVQKRLLLGKQQRELKAWTNANKLSRAYDREKAYGVAKQPKALYTKSNKASGALNKNNDPTGARREAHAISYYEQVRKRDPKREISTVARNSGIETGKVERAYNHLFVNEYELANGRKRFDADYDITQSWQRLRNGEDIQPHDLILIQHESCEYELMKSGLPYSEAHTQAEKYYNYNKEVDEWLKGRGDK